MRANINRMRKTFDLAAQRLEWTPADIAEYNADIKAAINKPDVARLQWWMEYLEQASNLASLAEQLRAAEARIHGAAALERLRASA